MKKINIILAFAFLSIAAFAATSWAPTTGSVKFNIKNAGLSVDGKFSGISASIKFDENDLANSNIYASVNATTINTGINKRDKHLRGEEYFDVANYPKITMKSTKIVAAENGYNGNFNVKIKGITKSIQVPFTFTRNGETGTFKGKLNLDRLDFGVGESGFVLSDEVNLDITLNVKKK